VFHSLFSVYCLCVNVYCIVFLRDIVCLRNICIKEIVMMMIIIISFKELIFDVFKSLSASFVCFIPLLFAVKTIVNFAMASRISAVPLLFLTSLVISF
jgi:hypothetical protein